MFRSFLEKLKHHWKITAGITAAILVVITSIFTSSKEKKSKEKDLHDKFVEGQDNVIQENKQHEERVSAAVVEYEDDVKEIEEDIEDREKELASLGPEALTKSLAEMYNIKIQDRKP